MINDENMGRGIVNPFPGQRTEWVNYSGGPRDSGNPDHSEVHEFTDDPGRATAVTSLMRSPVPPNPFDVDELRHKPVIDLDIPAKLVPSTTPGHFHLFIDCPMSQSRYEKLLTALADAGLVEPGYVQASIRRGYTSVRLPHVRKEF